MQLEIKDGLVLSWATGGTLLPREGATIVTFDGTLADLARVGDLPEGYPAGAADFRRYAAPDGAPPAPVPAVITLKGDVIRRCTDDEAEALDAALTAAGAKLRLLWHGVQAIDHGAPEFATLREAVVATMAGMGLTTTKAAKRADELLAASA